MSTRTVVLSIFAAAAIGLAAAAPAPQDPEAKKLANERLEAATFLLDHFTGKHAWSKANAAPETVALWSRRVFEASVAAGKLTKAEALAEHVARLELRLKVTQDLYQAGRRSILDVRHLQFLVAEAKGLAN